ncbi:MAG: alpha/beta hydrolase [Myxococcota bacterium]
MIRTIPGWQGSGPLHWQTLWERLDARVIRVEQDDWERPALEAWRARLVEQLAAGEPTVLVAHSLGCHLVAHAASELRGVVGALLVAPPWLESAALPEPVRSFAPSPRVKLPFKSVLVASNDDPWCPLHVARGYAADWGARFVDVGAQGHLNSESRLGSWPEGRGFLRELTRALPFTLDARLAADTHLIGESPLSLLLLMDDARYPWCILVPKRSGVSEAFELPPEDQGGLAAESALLASAMTQAFTADKLNVGALGNVVRQLHVHHVVRMLGDPAWPGPVWGHSPRVPRAVMDRRLVVDRLFSHASLAARFERR